MSRSPLSSEEIKKQFTQACLLHEQGAIPEAVKIYTDLLAILPELPQLHFNYALALYDQGDHQEAEIHYKKAATLSVEDPDIHYNRGLNFRRLDQIQKAAESFERAFRLGDHDLNTLYNLGLCYQDLSQFSQAALLYDSILTKDANHLSTLNNYAYLCHKTGATKKAEELYRRLLLLNPEHQAARHMLHSLSGKTPDNAPLEYVEEVFDNYAQTFEHSLVEQLSYKTPEGIWQRYCSLFPGDQRDLCLDLGCGTGLAGEQFSPRCKRMFGVDISQEMLTIAEKKNLYDKLIKSDITNYLSTAQDSPDLILAADVFTYLGDLEILFQLCYQKIIKGGLFLFSVEESDNDSFTLKETGRFGHSLQYIRKLSQKTGWTIHDQYPSKLRQEKGEWITGYLFILEK